MTYVNTFDDFDEQVDIFKPTLAEELVEWCQAGVCRVRYRPTFGKVRTIEVTKLDGRQLIGRDLAMVYDFNEEKPVCIGTYQIKWFELLE